MNHTFRVGDVVQYTSERANRWCREGMAIADVIQRGGPLRLIDTYWSVSGDNHILTDAEIATAELLFNIEAFDELDRYNLASPATWETFAENDRQLITSQHALEKRWFIRKGSQPNLDTQIGNARRRVEKAEDDLRHAESCLADQRQRLAELEAQRPVDVARPVGLVAACGGA